MADRRRAIPSVERLLSSAALQRILAHEPRHRIVAILRALQDEQRALANVAQAADADWYAAQVAARLGSERERSLCNVINATGVVLHTNLGRAPLSSAAIAAISQVSRGYANVEYDVEKGSRGSRYTHCERLLMSLTGADAALVVNNNAAALVLIFNTIALGRPVLVSRGELVEIGDSFRVSEIVARSGARLCEVGATNRTHLVDYTDQLADAAAILKVHPSNFRTSGFVAEVTITELAPVARAAAIPLVHDLGSGLLETLDDLGLPHEPTAAEVLSLGADLVTMSGDKLLGGPQAGIALGRADIIEAMKRNPLCRALRVDKLTIAALEATLQSYVRGTARDDIPALRMIAEPAAGLRQRAEQCVRDLAQAGVTAAIADGFSKVGGGAYPEVDLPTSLVVIDSRHGSASSVEARLRAEMPPVIARIAGERVVLDLRTVLPEQQAVLVSSIVNVC
jgi:L-seryl-tRNA(Ser) seleniumtransferase